MGDITFEGDEIRAQADALADQIGKQAFPGFALAGRTIEGIDVTGDPSMVALITIRTSDGHAMAIRGKLVGFWTPQDKGDPPWLSPASPEAAEQNTEQAKKQLGLNEAYALGAPDSIIEEGIAQERDEEVHD